MKVKKKSPPKAIPTTIQGLLLTSSGLILLLSLLSFADGDAGRNWLGLVGHVVGWGLTYLFGLAAYFVPVFLGWWGVSLIRHKTYPHPRLKSIYLLVLVVSVAILLAMLTQGNPNFAAAFGTSVYSDLYGEEVRHYLGGVPFHRIYADLYAISFSHLLGGLGTFLIFATLSAAAAALLTEVRLAPVYAFLKGKVLALKKVEIKVPKLRRTTPFAAEKEIEREEPVLNVRVPQVVKKPAPIPVPKTTGDYTLPPAALLTEVKARDISSLKSDLKRQAEVLEETLLSFGIEAKVGDIHCGPTITSFELHPAVGVKVQKIKTLESDIALNMQARSIRIIAPIPGKAAVGIEVPNRQPQEVGFREMLENYQRGAKKGTIPLLLGKLVNGDDIWADLTKMPHMIIAGATGSGKSVCINTIVMSILMNARPDEIKLVMVDPKKVELTAYSGLPHMLAPVITESDEACAALQWLVKEMERRYEIFRQLSIRNIQGFNGRKRKKEEEELEIEVPEKLPFIVVIIDELADLMMVASSDIETPIARIAQMARAVGIHLILATQRPSREVITGLIKANFPTRLAFKVSSRVNSQIIIDENGAECLLGNGDLLFMPPGTSHLVRAQGAFMRDEDINRVIEFVERQAPTNYMIPSFRNLGLEVGGKEESDDPFFAQAKQIVLETGTASTTFLQRKLKIGYARAASLMDELEKCGVIGPQEGARPRKIFYPAQDE